MEGNCCVKFHLTDLLIQQKLWTGGKKSFKRWRWRYNIVITTTLPHLSVLLVCWKSSTSLQDTLWSLSFSANWPTAYLNDTTKPTGKKTPTLYDDRAFEMSREALMHFKGTWAVSISGSFSHSLHCVLFLIPNDCWLRFNPKYLFKKPVWVCLCSHFRLKTRSRRLNWTKGTLI